MEWMKESLGEELFTTVKEKLGDIQVIKNDGSYIPKTKFNEINENNKILKEQLKVFEQNSLQFEEMTRNNAKLSEQYNNLKTETQKQLDIKEKELLNVIKTTKIKEILAGNKALYPDLLLSQIDLDFIKLDGDNLLGFNVDDLKTKFPSMFQIKDVTSDIQEKWNAQSNNSVFGKQSSKKAELIEAYNKAEKERNFALCNAIIRQIKDLQT